MENSLAFDWWWNLATPQPVTEAIEETHYIMDVKLQRKCSPSLKSAKGV